MKQFCPCGVDITASDIIETRGWPMIVVHALLGCFSYWRVAS